MNTHMCCGKRADNEEWVVGYYLNMDIDWDDNGIHQDWIVASVARDDGRMNMAIRYPVIPETVGRFTGKRDMNGEDLYENDLVYVYDSNCDEEDGVGLIIWNNNESCYEVEFRGVSYNLGYCDSFMIEEIGNSFDNKELVGE